MEYILNESGDIKLMDSKGETKWLPKKVVEDSRLMKRMGFTIVQKPKLFESIKVDPIKEVETVKEVIAEQVLDKIEQQVVEALESKSIVAEPAQAKRRGRPPVNQ